ncbi:MAG TPA: galactokinase [Streptosporangiaceae bacterium]|jgi:galactokinase
MTGRAAAWFGQCYQRAPEGVWHAPGRVNLIGEHTDYNEGFVLPFALRRGIWAAAARRSDGLLELRSRQFPGEPVTVALDWLAPGSVTGWAAYPAGVAWALRRAGHDIGGASLAIDADLAAGAALSSSAALECAAALALAGLYQLAVPRAELARLAAAAENDFAGVPAGIMDQSASLRCEAGHALLLDCRTGAGTAVPLDLAGPGLALLLIDTRTRRALADGRYAARRRACEEAARALGVRALRDVTDSSAIARRLTDPVLRRAARHVITENARVLAAADLLLAGRPGGCGELLTASHQSLRDDFAVSWPQADAAVSAAVRAGALGARMTGGGFAGAVIALIPQDRLAQVRASVSAAFGRDGWQPPGFSQVRPAAGAGRLR